MTITFFSSVLNHHQYPFCEYMASQPDVIFHFVQMIPLNQERIRQGFLSYQTPYLVLASEDREKAKRLCMESDVVIGGVIPQDWMNKRVASGKLTFSYKERFFKSFRTMISPRFWLDGMRNYFFYQNQNLYFLCASAYTAKDTALILPKPDKKRKWGYFPAIAHHSDIEEVLSQKKPNSILWAGRFLACKHPETAIRLAQMLKQHGYQFSMDMIGVGELREKLSRRICAEHLEDCIHLQDAVPNEVLKKRMRETDVFLFTSDRNEGWGAVVNEAMSEGCVCLASKQAGCSKFLIKDGENGYILDYDDTSAWFQKLSLLFDNREQMRRMQRNAWTTIETEWNERIAGQRLIAFSRAILQNRESEDFESGPMSRA